MRTNVFLAAAGFIALAAMLPTPRVYADDASLARVIAGSELEAKADWEKRLPELVLAFEKDPESPFAIAALRRILDLVDDCRGREIVEQKLDPILTRGIRDGEIDETLREVLAKRARERGDWDRAKSYDAGRGYLRAFAAVGPLGWQDDALVHRRYGPEDAVLDPKATWEGSRRRVGWTKLAINPETDWIDPWTQLRDAGTGIWYAVARVKNAGARPALLKVVCSNSFKVLVNGREVVVADRDRDFVPWTVLADARLVDGWNRIVVKVAGRASFALKVCDPATGLPLGGLEEGDPLEGGPCADPGPQPEPRTYLAPIERVLAAATGEASGDAARVAVAADLAGDDRRTWDAYKLHEKAAAAVGEANALTANVHAWRGRFLSDFQPFPAVQRKLRAKSELEAAQKAFPGQTSSAVRLAEYENEDDHPDKCVKALRALLAQNESYNAWMSLARIAKARGWDAEAVEAAQHAHKLEPLAAGANSFLDDVDTRLGDWAAVLERAKAALEADRSSRGAAQTLVVRMRAEGRHAEALKMLEDLAARWPHELGWRRQIADTLASLDRSDEAIAMWTALAAKLPNDDGLLRRIGEVRETRGDKPGALEAYRASLAIEPFQPNLWRAVTRIEGKDEDFGAGWEPDVTQLLAALPSTEDLKTKFPKAVAITVLDHMVTRVNPDGSARSYVHMVYKLLDEKGVAKYGDLPNQGELLQVRAILPDGTVTTPTGLGRGNDFNMEGLVPGTVLDHRFMLTQRSTPKGFDGGIFTFQDSDIDRNANPVMLSRLVVLTPASLRLDPRRRNFPVDPKVDTKDGWTSTVWENRDAPVLEPESRRPPNDEIFPLVDYSIPPVFDDAAWQLFAQRPDSRGSPMVDEALAKCVKAGMSDLDKLHAIYDWVNTEITGDSGGGNTATAVLLEKSGSRALLFEAMARAAGVPYRLGRALPWDGSGRKLADQDADHFSDGFLWFEPKGAEPFPFFMLGHHAPFGLVPEQDRGSSAFLLDESGGRITRLAQGGLDVDDASTFAIRLGADASSTSIDGTLHYRSPNGYAFKRRLVDMSEDQRRKFAEGQITDWFANPTLETFEFPLLAEHGKPLDLHVSGTMSTYLTQQGDAFVASLGLVESGMTKEYVDRAERKFDLVINARDDRVDEFTIDLGDAWAVKSLPQDHVALHDIGTYSLTWRHDGNLIRVRRERHFHPARYRPDEYKTFVAWCKAIDDAEDRKLELRKVK